MENKLKKHSVRCTYNSNDDLADEALCRQPDGEKHPNCFKCYFGNADIENVHEYGGIIYHRTFIDD